MRERKISKVTTSVTFDLVQLEPLNAVANREGVSRSTIVRDAIERELERYESSVPTQSVESSLFEKGRAVQ